MIRADCVYLTSDIVKTEVLPSIYIVEVCRYCLKSCALLTRIYNLTNDCIASYSQSVVFLKIFSFFFYYTDFIYFTLNKLTRKKKKNLKNKISFFEFLTWF